MPDVTGITALDVGIGLAFMYVLFSVLVSAVQEAIAGVLDLRAATLEDGLRNLLDDDGEAQSAGAPTKANPAPPGPGDPGVAPLPGIERGDSAPRLTDELLGHGLIRTQYRASRMLFQRKRRGPSYLPAKTVAVALLDLIAPAAPGDDPMAAARTAIDAANIPLGTKHALAALARDAGDSRDRLRELVEQWFDAGMDRVSGWYKRKSQVIVCVLSLIVTIALNVNSIAIADRLGRDDAVRAAVVAQATTSTSKPGDSLNTVADEITNVHKLGLPIGWSKQNGDPVKADLGGHFWRTAGGWLITFLMLSLGAPFWFDLLGRLVALRSSGTKPTPQGTTPAAAGTGS